MLELRRQETHDETIDRIWREIEEKRLAEIEAQYAPKPMAEPTKSKWTACGGDDFEMSIPPRPGSRRIHGLASSSTINTHNYSLIAHGVDAELPVSLLSSHKGHNAPIGSVFYIRKTNRLVYVRAELNDNESGDFAWGLIERGELRCFSGAAVNSSLRLQGIVEDKAFYGQWMLGEVSICKDGANPDSVFEILREGDDGRKFWEPSSSARKVELNIPYRGSWKTDSTYAPGDFVSHQGGLWHSEIESKGLRPNESPMGWRLVVKRGAVEKLEKAHADTQA
ncbi:hypothetical protein [Mesorhizobium sp. M1252]|uniref:hypothetical protein n=1 Tax=Mesorhizobium sp. M1252 TaxID=2957073 RepID=UPI00333840CA